MTHFLIIAVCGTLLVALIMVWPLVTGGARARGREDLDAALYRDQLSELERDVARGTINASEAEGAKAEIARRLIAAAKQSESAEALNPAPPAISRMTAAIALIAAPALAALLYLQIGSPGKPDQPLAERRDTARASLPSQDLAERLAAERRPAPPALDPQSAQLLQRLEAVVASRPLEIRGHRILARTLASVGRWVDARQAYDKLITILGANATAEDHANHAEAMIFAATGYVSPQATAALERALRRDPSNTIARYYAGFALRQNGRALDAVALWNALLEEDRAAAEPRGSEWQSALTTAIAETRTGPGPTSDDLAAAYDMTPEERLAMINGMVERLEDRLTDNGGEPEEWVRLIGSYMQLGKMDDALRIYRLSQQRIGEPTARAFVRERALVMGLELE